MNSKALLGVCLLLAVVVSDSEAVVKEVAKLAGEAAQMAKTRASPNGALKEVFQASGPAREAPEHFLAQESGIARRYFSKNMPTNIAERRQIFSPKTMPRNSLAEQQRMYTNLAGPQFVKAMRERFQNPPSQNAAEQKSELPDLDECKKNLARIANNLPISDRLKRFDTEVAMDMRFGMTDAEIKQKYKGQDFKADCEKFSNPLKAAMDGVLKGCNGAFAAAGEDFRGVAGQNAFDMLYACEIVGAINPVEIVLYTAQ